MSQRINWNKLADEVFALDHLGESDDRRSLSDAASHSDAAAASKRPPGTWTRVRHSLVWYLLRRQTPWIVTMLVLGAVLFALTIITAQLTASIFDDAIIEQTASLEGLVSSLIIVAIADFIFGFANRQVTARIGYQLEFDLRNLLYLRLQRAVPRDLDEVSTGQMVTRALTDLRVLEIVIRIIPELMRALPILLGILVYLLLQSVPLTLVAISAIPINAYLINRIRKRLWGLAFLSLNQKAEITTAIDEPVRGIRVVKTFGQEAAEGQRVAEAARKAYRFVMTRVRLEAKFDLILRAAPVLVRAALLLFGARLVVAGHLSLGQFTVFFLFSAVFSGIAQAIDEMVAAWQMAKSGVGRIFQLLNMSSRIPGGVEYAVLPEAGEGLRARGVGVTYGTTPVLAGVDLDAPPGSFVVVTGSPGSGKSSLAAVVSGNFPSDGGEITLDGVDIGSLDPELLPREIHVASEEAFLFARSVRDNLLLGSLRHATATRTTITDEDLHAALLAAAADEIVADLDAGLDEVLGDRGMTLSGGQRQRLALARALVSPPRVLILDDALSAVNPSLEIDILERIRAHAPETAVICITRRPGPQRLADRVVSLDLFSSPRADTMPVPMPTDSAGSDEVPELLVTQGPEPVEMAFKAEGEKAEDPGLIPTIDVADLSIKSPHSSEGVASDSPSASSDWSTLSWLSRWVGRALLLFVLLSLVGIAPEDLFGNSTGEIQAVLLFVGLVTVGLELFLVRPQRRARSWKDAEEAEPVEMPSHRASADPYDPRLVPIIAGIDIADDRPRIPESLASDSRSAPSVRSTVAPLLRWMVGATVLLVLMTAVGLAPEYLLGNAADAIEAQDNATTDRYALFLVLLAAGTGILNYLFRIASNRVNQDVLYLLRRCVFARLSRMGIDYYDRELPGRVSARVVHDLDVLSNFFDDGLYRLVASVALFFMVLGIMAWLSPEVALLVLVFAFAVTLVTIVQVPIADRAFQRARLATGDVVARLQEDFAGRYVVSAFGAERQARLEFGAVALELRSARRWATTVANAYTEVVSLLASIGAALIFLRAGNLALAGVLSTGMVLTLRLYLQEAMRPIPTMGRIWQDYLQARVAFRQLAHPYEAPVLPVERPGAVDCPPLRGAVRFEGVRFTYPSTSREVLHDVEFDIEPGMSVALVGYTGAGKSSVAKLLGRTYDPDEGRVLVDDHDLCDLTLASFRQRLGVVPQDAFVFKGTVASNIAYGRPEASRDEIVEAAMAVGADAMLSSLPRGYDAVVEEEGRNLTAAQRQLIALSRAWLTRPDILVLDEATSAFDPVTEQGVLDAVAALGCTTILIAHRLPVAERADHVLLMDRGEVVATGSHRDLMATQPRYSSLWIDEGATAEAER